MLQYFKQASSSTDYIFTNNRGQAVTICASGYRLLESLDFSILGIDNNGYLNVTHYIIYNGYRFHRTTRIHTLLTDCPKNMTVDHKDGDPSNNRLDNLRVVTMLINSRNKRLSANTKTSHRHIAKYPNAYRVVIFGKHIGYFKNIEDAISARDTYYETIDHTSFR